MDGAHPLEGELRPEPAARDTLALGPLYEAFERRLLAYFMRAAGRPELAVDLAAETFARALECAGRFDPSLGNPEQWLFGIARKVLAESYRSGRVESRARSRLGMPRLVIDDHAAETIARLAGGEEPAMLALAGLPAAQHEAIGAHVIEERAYEDIARELRCSEAVVRQRVSRGLKTLRIRLGGGP